MSEEPETRPVLHRMAQVAPTPKADVPLTASRAIRLAITRSAERRIGMAVSVGSLAEDLCPLDDLLTRLDDRSLLMAVRTTDGVIGVAAASPELVAASVEVQTTGHISNRPAAERALTAADAAMVVPFFTGFLEELQNPECQAAIGGWGAEVTLADRIGDAREVGFVLADGTYRLIALTLDLGGGERQGELMLALPAMDVPRPVCRPQQPSDADWKTELKEAVLAAPARLDAVLHRFRTPLAQATCFEVGQVIPLTGCSVSAVQLVAGQGTVVARGRLGQVAGQIAVRIEAPATLTLDDMPAAPAHTAIKAVPDESDLIEG